VCALFLGGAACSAKPSNAAAGGAPSFGGALSGGAGSSGGSTSGGASAGPAGEASGGSTSGGSPTSGGGSNSGGSPTSGGASAGSNSGGGHAGGTSAAGAASAGESGSSGGDPCGKSGRLLCDDFEKFAIGTVPTAPWSMAANGTNGTVLVDGTTPAHSGTKSIRVSSLGNYQTFLALKGAPVFPAPKPALYARTFIRLDAPMTGGHNTYFKAGAGGAISSNNETRVGVMVEMLMINQPDGDRGFLSNNNYWTDQKPGVVFAEKTWVCVEAFFDPPSSTVDVWVNGKAVPDLHRSDWKQDALGTFQFGFEKYAGPDADIWYDDIVISTEPIGCG